MGLRFRITLLLLVAGPATQGFIEGLRALGSDRVRFAGRPEFSRPRKDIIIDIKEDFGDHMGCMIDAGTHKLLLQGATDKVTD